MIVVTLQFQATVSAYCITVR